MAPRADTAEEIGLSLETARLMLADLAEIAKEWQALSEAERDSWSLNWDNEMAGVARLARQAAAGNLTSEQQDKYRHLAEGPPAALPTIRELGLRLPSKLVTGDKAA